MKICDRCHAMGDSVPSADSLTRAATHETFDLCLSCIEQVNKYITQPRGVDGSERNRETARKTKN